MDIVAAALPEDNHVSQAEILARELSLFSEVEKTSWGWRSQCPVTSCRDNYSGSSFVFANAGDQLVVRCNAFCKDSEVREALDRLLEPVLFIFERDSKEPTHLPPNQRRSFDALDFSVEKIPPPVAFLSPWVTEESLSMIYAKTGLGKTWLALAMANAIATGSDLLKWKCSEPRRVLYVDGEMSQSDMHKRVNLLFATRKPEQGMFGLLCNFRSKEGLLDLSTPEGQDMVEAELGHAKVLFLDNITTLFRNRGENEAESWASAERWLLSLRARRLAVVLLHHSGKSGSQRGTSRREIVLNNIVRLNTADSEDEGCSFEVHFEKARDLTTKDKKPFKANLTTTELDRTVFVWSELRGAMKEEALALHAQGLKVREIGRKLGINSGSVSRYLQKPTKNKPSDL